MRITKRHLNLVQEEELAAEKLQPTYSVFGGSYENKQHWMLSVQSINTEYKLLSSVSHLPLIVHLTYIMCSQTHQLNAKMIEFVSSFPPPSYQGKQPKKKSSRKLGTSCQKGKKYTTSSTGHITAQRRVPLLYSGKQVRDHTIIILAQSPSQLNLAQPQLPVWFC